MKVLHVHSGNLYGGVETFLRTLAEERRTCPQMEPSFALCFEGRLAGELRAAGVEVELLGPVRLSRPLSVFAARRALRRSFSTRRPDVVVCHAPWSFVVFAAEVRRAGLEPWLFVHGAGGKPGLLDRAAALLNPAGVLSNSQFTGLQASARFPSPRHRVVLLPAPPVRASTGARERLRAEAGASEAVCVILQVSRFEPWKGQRRLLEAFAQLPAGSAQLWLVGGAQREEEEHFAAALRRLADSLQLAESVRFLGQRTDVGELLAAADIFCQPNVEPEPFGLGLLEAMQAGLPVVTSALGAAPEVVGDAGILVGPSAGAVAEALRGLLGDPQRRQQLGAAGRARAEQTFGAAARLSAFSAALREPAT